MRFVSWNVNGIRAVLKKNFLEVFDAFDADIFAIQETKCQVGQVELDLPGYHQYWSAAEKKGYSGTAVLSREEPLRVLHGLGNEYLDAEGRIVACEFPQFWFVNVYTPNSQMELARIDHRMEWDDAFRDFCKGLEAGVLPDGTSSDPKPVVMCGDFNVAHEEIDLKKPGPQPRGIGLLRRGAREVHRAGGRRFHRHVPFAAPGRDGPLQLVELPVPRPLDERGMAHRLLPRER